MPKTCPAALRKDLKSLLDAGDTIIVPGCHDALSAMVVAEAGFEVAYIGSYATAAADLGLPDVGALGLDDLVQRAQRVADVVATPLVADAEGGFHQSGNIWRTVNAFEHAGVSAIHIEDHAGGKHTDLPQALIPLGEMVAKLKAAVDARSDPNFQIIARTDAIWATGDPAEALRRMQAFQLAGADMLFPTGATPEMIAAFRAELPAHYVVIDGPGHPRFAGLDTAASLVLYYGFSLFAATRGLTSALRRFRADPAADLGELMEPVDTFEDRLGYKEFSARSRRYQSASSR